MARKPRREFPDGVYHTTARGTGRIDIVRDAIDCEAFIKFLSLVVQRWNWQIAAYCLMSNHYHVVLEATVQDLSKGMHALNGRHARRFNERHERDGHLFQERFDAHLIETEEHLAAACEYVLDNPVRAGLCRERRDWPWSSAATSR